MKKFQCLEDRVLILPIKKEEEKSDGGLIMDMVKKEVGEGEVYDAGPGRYAIDTGVFIPSMLNKGDTVIYPLNFGMEMKIEGRDMRLMREGDVLILVSRKAAQVVSENGKSL